MYVYMVVFFFFFLQKTAYDILFGDWRSDVCSSDLYRIPGLLRRNQPENLIPILPLLTLMATG